jgi:hypothetical protein
VYHFGDGSTARCPGIDIPLPAPQRHVSSVRYREPGSAKSSTARRPRSPSYSSVRCQKASGLIFSYVHIRKHDIFDEIFKNGRSFLEPVSGAIMDERIARLESLVGSLAASVRHLEQRVVLLEGGANEGPRLESSAALEDSVAATSNPTGRALAAFRSTPALVGRSLLVLAGGFVLRALTESGTVSPGTGIALGLVYAAVWVAAAARDAHRGRQLSASFFAACAAAIGNPLLFEAVTSFGVLSETAAALALTGMTGFGLVVAARWRMRGAAWVFSLGCVATAVALAMARPPGESASAVLVTLGLAWLWFDQRRGWEALKWITAGVADVAVLRLTAMALVPHALPPGFGVVHLWLVVTLQAVLVIGYLGAVAVRVVRGDGRIRAFDVVQAVAVWAVGWGGAVRLAGAHDWQVGGLFAVALAVGAASYIAAFGVVDRRHGRNRAFYFFSSVGVGLLLLGMPGVAGSWTAVVWAAIGVAVAVVGSRWDRVTLRVHAVVLLVVAWAASGLGAMVVGSLRGFGAETAVAAPAAAVLTLTATGIVLAGRRRVISGWMERLPLALLLAMSSLAIAAVLVTIARPVAPGTAVALGTVALATVTVLLGFLASRWRVTEAGWLVYPMLALTGLKVVSHDLPAGRALVLVVALAAYGFALVVAPWLLRSGHSEDTDETAAPAPT